MGTPKKYRCRGKGEGHKERICIMCDKPFLSTSPGNRRCPKCKYKAENGDYWLPQANKICQELKRTYKEAF